MTIPAFLFGMLLATLFGSVFHLWRGGGLSKLMLYIFLAWFGFWGGHALGDQMEWGFLSVGPLHVGSASLGSWSALGLGYWLSLVKEDEEN